MSVSQKGKQFISACKDCEDNQVTNVKFYELLELSMSIVQLSQVVRFHDEISMRQGLQ